MPNTNKPISINRLSQVHDHFLASLPPESGEVTFNVVLSFRFRQQCIRDDADLGRIGEAQQWQALQPNEFLYFTHGQYANRDNQMSLHESLALKHIVGELRRKPTSRRALLSLLHTGDVVDTGDKPIPSLVLFQCGLVGNELIATTYFRALEIKHFLPINIAEFALWARYLRDHHVSFDWITWTIHAFQAYAAPKSNCLRRPEAASYSPIRISGIASRKDYTTLGELIAGFGCREAYLVLRPFEWLCEAIEEFINDSPLIPRLVAARDLLRAIAEQTQTHSFGEDLDRSMGEFITMVEELSVEASRLGGASRG